MGIINDHRFSPFLISRGFGPEIGNMGEYFLILLLRFAALLNPVFDS
jgi:hypothetical protein